MLTGTELLTKVKELGDVSKTDLATQCGYVFKKKDAPDHSADAVRYVLTAANQGQQYFRRGTRRLRRL